MITYARILVLIPFQILHFYICEIKDDFISGVLFFISE